MSLNFVLTHQLVGWNGERAYAGLCALALVVNLVMNARLIPAWSIDGAAWATLGTELFLTAGCVVALWTMTIRDERHGSRGRGDRGAGMSPSMMTSREMAIARSVIYASLFDYPAHAPAAAPHADRIRSDAVRDPGGLRRQPAAAPDCRSSGRLLFSGRARRPHRRAAAARSAGAGASSTSTTACSRLLCALPFTRLVALSGSMAHLNLEPDGDLDLFIVTRGRRVWTVTVAVILLTKLLRRRRVVCANFVLADSHLALEPQDLFTANQVLHLKPVIGEEWLDAFLAANPFVTRLYPNALGHLTPAIAARRPQPRVRGDSRRWRNWRCGCRPPRSRRCAAGSTRGTCGGDPRRGAHRIKWICRPTI
jgi:hypothetical protein